MSTLKPLIAILGPTASGKTELALRLARKFNGEIVNADSRQVYREMDIGTGKIIITPIYSLSFPRKRESTVTFGVPMPTSIYTMLHSIKWIPAYAGMTKENNTPTHLIDIINPDEDFSLAQYKKLAISKIRDIQKRGKIPFLVGGTGLYVSAVVDNLEIPKVAPDKKIRERLDKLDSKKLFSQLKKVDLKSAEIIGENNKRKMIRALEVYEITGRPFSIQQAKGKPLFNVLQIGIKMEREKLYKKIDQRVDEMIKAGLVKEVEGLAKKYSFSLPSMSGIGYQEIGLYLENKISLADAVQKIKFRTHQYARRQMTWFKRDEKIEWVEDYREARILVSEFLEK